MQIAPDNAADPVDGRSRVSDLALVVALALAVALIGLSGRSLWLDEAITAQYAEWGLRRLLAYVLRFDPNSTLYYVGLERWATIFGTGEFALRLPSCLANAIAAGFVYLVGVRLFSRGVGLLAATLFACNAFVVEYAQMARGYALATCLVTASSWLLIELMDRPRVGAAIAYAGVAAMAFWTHYFAAFVVVAHAATVLVVKGREGWRREFIIAATLTFILSATALWPAMHAGGAATQWIPVTTWPYVWESLVTHAGGSVKGFWLFVVGSLAGTLYWQTRRRDAVILLTLWFAVPFALALLVSMAKPLFRAYYLIICVPAFMLLASSALTVLRARWRQWAYAVMAIAVVARPTIRYYGEAGREDWRSTAAYVQRHAVSGDAVAFDPWFIAAPFAYYSTRTGVPTLSPFAPDTAPARTVWLIRSHRHTRTFRQKSDSLSRALARIGSPRDSAAFADVDVIRFVAR